MKIYSLSAQPTSWKQTIPGTKHNSEAEFTNTLAKEVMYLPAFTVWVVWEQDFFLHYVLIFNIRYNIPKVYGISGLGQVTVCFFACSCASYQLSQSVQPAWSVCPAALTSPFWSHWPSSLVLPPPSPPTQRPPHSSVAGSPGRCHPEFWLGERDGKVVVVGKRRRRQVLRGRWVREERVGL